MPWILRARSSMGPRTRGRPEPAMTVARSVADVLRDHVTLELEGIDRMYLNLYVPLLQSVGGIVWYLREHRKQPYASTAAIAPMTEAFLRSIEEFVDRHGIDLVLFRSRQRKDDVTQKYLQRFAGSEGVLYVGKAQEKAKIARTQRRRSAKTGKTYPWIVEGSAMVNYYYFYCVDEDFGPFFLKFCSYFPYNAKLNINGHEYLKRQLAKRGVPFEPLSTTVSSPAPTPRWRSACATGCRRPKSTSCCANGFAAFRIRFRRATVLRAIATKYRSCRPSSRSPRCSTSRSPAAFSSKRSSARTSISAAPARSVWCSIAGSCATPLAASARASSPTA